MEKEFHEEVLLRDLKALNKKESTALCLHFYRLYREQRERSQTMEARCDDWFVVAVCSLFVTAFVALAALLSV